MTIGIGKKVISTENSVASLVGAKIFEKGGNAFDAAIAASAVNAVVMQHVGGIGGDGFLLASTPEGILAYNATGWSPKKFDNLQNIKIHETSPYSIMIPGLVDLWDFARMYAKFPLEELLKPAISLARNGFFITRHFLDFSKSLHIGPYMNYDLGDIVRLPKLADILGLISKNPREFYEGVIAEEIVSELNKLGNDAVTVNDFREFKGERVKPLSIQYKDFKVYELPPNSQGISTLELVKLIELSNINIYPYNSIKRIKILDKLTKIVYNDRDLYVADSRFSNIPYFLIDEDYLYKRLKGTSVINNEIKKKDGDTTFIVTGDGENEVGIIQSLYSIFGSRVIIDEIIFNNRGIGFTSGLNKPQGRKRPLSTLSILYFTNDKDKLLIGCAGGNLRPQIHAQILSYYIDYQLDIDKAVTMPRFMFINNKIVSEEMINVNNLVLTKSGEDVGVVEAIKKKSDGTYIGVADPRGEGIAISIL